MTNAISKVEYEAKVASMMKESVLQLRVYELTQEIRVTIDPTVLYYHTHNSRRSPAGYPDTVIASERHGIQIVAELKREHHRNKPSADQVKWLDFYRSIGTPTFLWRPRHWLSGEIQDLIMAACSGRRVEYVPALSRW